MNRRGLRTFLVLLIPAAAVIIALVCTRRGVGVSPDSVQYIGAARNLAEGRGVTVPFAAYGQPVNAPLTHWPPFFPAILALPAVMGVDPLVGARWLNSFLFGASVFLVGFLLFRYTRNAWLALLGSVLTLLSTDMLMIHTRAYSEPLFLFLTLLTLLVLDRYLASGRLAALIGAAALAALAFLTRYAGASLVGAAVLGVLLMSSSGWGRRLRHSVLFGLVSVGPAFLWMLRNRRLAGTMTRRAASYHPIRLSHLVQARDVMAGWLMPGRIGGIARSLGVVAAILIALVLAVLLLRRRPGQQESRTEARSQMPYLFLLFLLCYAGIFVVSISFFDALLEIDARQFAVFFAGALLAVLGLLNDAWRARPRGRALKVAAVAACLGFVLRYGVLAANWIPRRCSDGIGFNSRVWRESALISRVRELSPQAPIYSNGFDAVYFLTGRPAEALPHKYDPMTTAANGNLVQDIQAMAAKITRQGGCIVYFTRLNWRPYLPAIDEIAAVIPLRRMAEAEDGAIYSVGAEQKPDP